MSFFPNIILFHSSYPRFIIILVFHLLISVVAHFIILCKNTIRKDDTHMVENRIRELRKSLNMSQEMLAEKIGTTQQAVSRMENNAYDIPSDILIVLERLEQAQMDSSERPAKEVDLNAENSNM
jgi:plasmid maintenance system antidote protein VapI